MKEFWTAQRTIFPAVYRVVVGLILLTDLISSLPSLKLLFNPELNAYLPQSGILGVLGEHIIIFVILYALALLLFIFGLGRNLASFLVFVGFILWVQMTDPLRVWGDTILKFSLMYFVFADSFRYLSLRKTYGRISWISVLAVWSIILNVFLIYLNNAWFKLDNKDWQEGIAVFYSFSQYPDFKESILYPLVINGFWTRAINYAVILWQLLFVPLILWKKTRWAMILLSAFIHLVMMFEFGLWKFELIVILQYGFLLSDGEWLKVLPVFGKRIAEPEKAQRI